MNTDKRKEMTGGDAGLDQQIESLMDRLTVEKAPASLSRRRTRLPRSKSPSPWPSASAMTNPSRCSMASALPADCVPQGIR